jgi:hypothetical protein
VALADGLAASSVMPRSLRERAWPRSTTRLPVHDEVHQSVPASPSIAFAAGLADSEEVALACPDSAQSTAGAAARGPELRWAAPGEVVAPASPAISGSASTAGSAVAASARLSRRRRARPTAAWSIEYARRGTSSMAGSVLRTIARDRTYVDSTGH